MVTTRPLTFLSYRAAGIESRFWQDSQVTTNPITLGSIPRPRGKQTGTGVFLAEPSRPVRGD